MKKFLYILALLSLILTGCYDNLSEQTHTDLENLKIGRVATVQQQVANITASIGTLQTMRDELEKYISILQNVKSGLDADYAKLNQALNSLKTDIQTEMDGARAEMLSEYEAVGNALTKKISEINNVLNVLFEKKESLNNLLDSLRKNLDENYATTDWIKTTLATLESQNKIVSEVSEIKAHVNELSESLVETERKIIELLEGRLDELNTTLYGKFYNEIAALDKAYKDAITKASADVAAALDEALKDAISDCLGKLKGWVNEQLDGYFTIAEAKSKLLAFQTLVGNVPEGKNIQGEIAGLVAAYDKAMEEITAAYVLAITAAIEKSDSDMDEYIEEQLLYVYYDLEDLSIKLNVIEGEVARLQSEVISLKTRINSIEEQISAINTSIAVLTELKMTLDEYLESIFDSIEEDYFTYYKGISAMIEALQTESNSIKIQIDDLKKYIGDLPAGVAQDNLVDWISSTEQTIRLQFDSYCTVAKIEELKASLESEIENQGKDITQYGETLSSLIDNAKSTIDSWVDAKLTDYHTAAELDVMIAELKTKLEGFIGAEDSEIQKKIDDLQKEYDDAVKDFEKVYTDAVKKAIEDNQSEVDQAFNDAIKDVNDKLKALTDRAAQINEDIETIRTALDKIKSDIEGISTDVTYIQSFIDESGYESLQAFVDYVNGVLKDCETTYATIDQYETLYDIIYGEEGLKYWVDQMTALTTRLEKAEVDAGKLESFFAVSDFKNETLKDILEKINKDRKDLMDDVFGIEGEKKGLQEMIDEILTKLYGGPDKDKDSATDGSIYKQIEVLKKKVIAATFASISYIPINESGTVNSPFSLEFYVCPAQLVDLLDESNCKLVNGSISSVSGNPSTGILTVNGTARSGQWIALDVVITFDDEEDGDKVEFISQYIQVK